MAAGFALLCSLMMTVPAHAQGMTRAQWAALEREPMSIHVISPRDTLIGIGERLLARPDDWRILQRLNRVSNPRRLQPGATLKIPLRLLRMQAVTASVESVAGDARADGMALSAGTTLAEGAVIETGDNGYVGLSLADGSRLLLQPNSRLQVEIMRRDANNGSQHSGILLQQGRVDNNVSPQKGPAARYEIRTPSAVIGVRGTQFRAAHDMQNGQARVEVIEGAVAAGRSAVAEPGVALQAGQGGVISAERAPQIATLLPAADLAAVPTLLERPLVRLPLPTLTGAEGWRVIVAAESAGSADFARPVYEATERGRELRINGLPDGNYRYRLRGIDALALEGREASGAFKLKARPEPPFGNQPAPGSKQRNDGVALAWTTQSDAATYRLQIAAADGSFAQPLLQIDDLREPRHLAKLPPGDYQWRLASVRADGDRGPWGDAQAFVLRAPQGPPEPPALGEQEVSFAWPAEPGQRFEFVMAADEGFGKLIATHNTDAARIVLPRPAPGRYWVRVRATDADGFVGAWSGAQVLDVPESPRNWWPLLLFLPLLAL